MIFNSNEPLSKYIKDKFPIIAGPCVIENKDHSLKMSESVKSITDRLGLPVIFKSSFDKANRTSLNSFRGPNVEKGLEILSEVKEKNNVPVLTDVHWPEQCKIVAEVVDVLQIPAFLCRQTDLLLNASNTGKIINIKKGQFLAPWDMINVVEKIKSTGNEKIILTERGNSFGYNNLVFDLRSLIYFLKALNCF